MSQHACITVDVPPADHFSALHRSGILCIAPPLKVLYMNVDARDVIARYNRSLTEECKTILRGEILAFCLNLLERLRRYHHVRHFELFEVHRRIEFPANAILLRGLANPKPSGLLQSRMCVLLDELTTTPDPSHEPVIWSHRYVLPTDPQEDLVLNVLQSADVLTMEQMIERLPELSWCELFHAIDTLSRQGTITLRRHGFDYEVAPVKVDNTYACVGLES